MLLNSKYLNKKKVFDLIHDDYHYAKVLNSFGIDFYKHYDENLNDLCESKGISFGVNRFGESAPYKKVYEHLDLSVEKIVLSIQNKLRK